MSRREDALSLRHMLEYAQEAYEMARHKKRRDLDRDRKLNLALVRLLEVIGEAARRRVECPRKNALAITLYRGLRLLACVTG